MKRQIILDFSDKGLESRIVNDLAGFGIVHGVHGAGSTISDFVDPMHENEFGMLQRFPVATFLFGGVTGIENKMNLPSSVYQSMNTSEIVGFFVGAGAILSNPEKVFPREDDFQNFTRIESAEEKISAIVQVGYKFNVVRRLTDKGFTKHPQGWGKLQERMSKLEPDEKDSVTKALIEYLKPNNLSALRRYNQSRAENLNQRPLEYFNLLLGRAAAIMQSASQKSYVAERRKLTQSYRASLMPIGDSTSNTSHPRRYGVFVDYRDSRGRYGRYIPPRR